MIIFQAAGCIFALGCALGVLMLLAGVCFSLFTRKG